MGLLGWAALALALLALGLVTFAARRRSGRQALRPYRRAASRASMAA